MLANELLFTGNDENKEPWLDEGFSEFAAWLCLDADGNIGYCGGVYKVKKFWTNPHKKELTAEEVKACINGLQSAGRHIGQRHYQMLLDKLHS